MVIDAGGARMWERDQQRTAERFLPKPPAATAPAPEWSVFVTVVETHDGEPCECIDPKASEMTLRVGDTIELTHTCHDGRVDKVTARVQAINGPPPVEHATVTKGRRP